MNRRKWISGAVGGLFCVPHLASAQSQFSRTIPSRTALAQVGLERHWFNAVPLAAGSSRVASMNLAGSYLFAQTTHGLVVSYDAETGRRLWTANMNQLTLNPSHVSVNDRMAIVTVGQKIYGLDLPTGTKIWENKLEDICTGGTAINSSIAIAALKNGKVQVFNIKDPGREECGAIHDPATCSLLKPSVGRYIYSWQTEGSITAKPFLNESSMFFAGEHKKNEGKFYLADVGDRHIKMRFVAKGPIRGNIGLYDTHQVIYGSEDHMLYCMDLRNPYRKETNWVFPASAPLRRAVIVSGDEAFTIDAEGTFYCIDARNGTLRWKLPVEKGRLLAMSPTRLYGITVDGALAVLNRADGRILVTPEQSLHSFGLDLKNYPSRMTNDVNDRIYLATEDGILICLRELGKVQPTPIRDPKLGEFGLSLKEINRLKNQDTLLDNNTNTGESMDADSGDLN